MDSKSSVIKKKLTVLKKKLTLIKISRIIIQLLFLYFFSGMFTLAFTGFKSMFLRLVREDFSLVTSFNFLAAFVAVVALSILMGRFFCGWLCAFGAYNDFLYWVSRKFIKKKIKIPQKIDEKLRYIKYIVLLFIMIVFWFMDLSPENSLSPWDAFAQLPQIATMAPLMPIAFTLLALITVGAILIERFFCKYLCPLGGILAITSKFKLISISKPTAQCGKCQLCTSKCPMGLNLSEVEAVDNGECIACLKCVDVCHRSNPQLVAFKKINLKWYSSTIAAILLFSFIFFGKKFIKPDSNLSNKIVSAEIANVDEALYNDGIYIGVGTGFRPNLQVEVKIVQGRISDIAITSHEETTGYYEQAFDIVPKEIIATQATDVDIVSGATKSSNGIKEAVADALKKARKQGTEIKNSTDNNNNTDKTEAKSENPSPDVSMDKGLKFKDGTFTGVGTGYQPGITVAVTITNGKISNIQITSDNETPGFKEKAFEAIPSRIIESQSTNVDIVSGATMSSKGIMAAVKNALEKAIISGELPKDVVIANTNSTTNNNTSNNPASSENLPTYSGNGLYKDGIYTGTGNGFMPNLKVSVTVSGGKITNITVLEHSETPGFYENAFTLVPNRIISKQNTNVDTVSGATRSSNGIIDAVNNALINAKLDNTPTTPSTPATPSTPTNPTLPTPTPGGNNNPGSELPIYTGDGLYKDGVYTGTGNGFMPNLKVSVTVKDKKISEIVITEHGETPGFYENAFNLVPKRIISKQNTDVDTISGATRSSKGIIEAVNNALKDAKLDSAPTDGNTIPTTPTNPTIPTPQPGGNDNSSNELPIYTGEGLYKDGLYSGTGNGFMPNLKVSVTVKDKKISEIVITEHDETPGFYENAFNLVPKRIISKQNTDIDTISGATRSSKGIIEAVNNALKDAKLDSTPTDGNTTPTPPTNPTNPTNPTVPTTPQPGDNTTPGDNGSTQPDDNIPVAKVYPLYKDGTYTGIGRGRRNNLIIDVTVKDSKITNIALISYREDLAYMKQAIAPMTEKIITAQSTEVDAVSGATQTSTGIKDAVNKALEKALYTDGTYTGTGRGYNRRTPISISVTVTGGKISNIDLVSQAETESYFNQVWPLIPSEIIKTQSLTVDGVSGATRSSNGIKNAVKAALSTATPVGETSTYPSASDVISPFRDGIYTGTANGYRNNLNVIVTIKDNKILKIELGENSETPSYFSKVWPLLPDQIISTQLPDVDAVSGATRSSIGISNAVKDALRKSKLALSADPVAPYKDGTYRGVAVGYKSGLNVDVTVKDNIITSIELKENNETPSYFVKAWLPVSTAIIEKQSTTVDTISGATRSSVGIMEAVKVALREAHDETLNLN